MDRKQAEQRWLDRKMLWLRTTLDHYQGCSPTKLCPVCGFNLRDDFEACPMCGGDVKRALESLEQARATLDQGLSPLDAIKALRIVLMPPTVTSEDRCLRCEGEFNEHTLICRTCGDRKNALPGIIDTLNKILQTNECSLVRVVGKTAGRGGKTIWRWTCWSCGTAQGNEFTGDYRRLFMRCRGCGTSNEVLTPSKPPRRFYY
jgi:hypothetical protein